MRSIHFILISVKKHGHIDEQLVADNIGTDCAVICTLEKQSGKSCNFYVVLYLQEDGKATCKYGFLKDITSYPFMKKENLNDRSISKVVVLSDETFGK